MLSSKDPVGPDLAYPTESLRLRYLSFLLSTVGGTPVNLYLADLASPIEASLDIWCPGEILGASNSEGIVCVKDLHTPLGKISKARLRILDVIAVEIKRNVRESSHY